MSKTSTKHNYFFGEKLGSPSSPHSIKSFNEQRNNANKKKKPKSPHLGKKLFALSTFDLSLFCWFCYLIQRYQFLYLRFLYCFFLFLIEHTLVVMDLMCVSYIFIHTHAHIWSCAQCHRVLLLIDFPCPHIHVVLYLCPVSMLHSILHP